MADNATGSVKSEAVELTKYDNRSPSSDVISAGERNAVMKMNRRAPPTAAMTPDIAEKTERLARPGSYLDARRNDKIPASAIVSAAANFPRENAAALEIL